MVPNYRQDCSVRQEALSGAYQGKARGWVGGLVLSTAKASSSSSAGFRVVREDEEEEGNPQTLAQNVNDGSRVFYHQRTGMMGDRVGTTS